MAPTADDTADAPATVDPSDELRRLRAESEARTAELREIAAQLPAVVGRRAMLKALMGDALANPNKGEAARRAWARIERAPSWLRHRIEARVRRDDPAEP